MATSQTYQSEVSRNVHKPAYAKWFWCPEKKDRLSGNVFFLQAFPENIATMIQNLDIDALNMNADEEEIIFSSRMNKEGPIFHSESYS